MRGTHGLTNFNGSERPEYHAWRNMRYRCFHKTHHAYKNYGARGITVCDRWLGRDGFPNFFSDMGERPTSNHTLERINNNGNYEPTNCKWATRTEQQLNRTISTKINGKNITVIEKELGLTKGGIRARLKAGWLLEKAISTISKKYYTKRKHPPLPQPPNSNKTIEI